MNPVTSVSRELIREMQSLRFPQKLWRMANECPTNAIRWSSNGKSIILNYKELSEQYLPTHLGLFKTSNITSFIRQLNLYGFKKISHGEMRSLYKMSSDYHEFRNANFVQGRVDLLKWVTRKPENSVPKRKSGEKAYFQSAFRGPKPRGRPKSVKRSKSFEVLNDITQATTSGSFRIDDTFHHFSSDSLHKLSFLSNHKVARKRTYKCHRKTYTVGDQLSNQEQVAIQLRNFSTDVRNSSTENVPSPRSYIVMKKGHSDKVVDKRTAAGELRKRLKNITDAKNFIRQNLYYGMDDKTEDKKIIMGRDSFLSFARVGFKPRVFKQGNGISSAVSGTAEVASGSKDPIELLQYFVDEQGEPDEFDPNNKVFEFDDDAFAYYTDYFTPDKENVLKESQLERSEVGDNQTSLLFSDRENCEQKLAASVIEDVDSSTRDTKDLDKQDAFENSSYPEKEASRLNICNNRPGRNKTDDILLMEQAKVVENDLKNVPILLGDVELFDENCTSHIVQKNDGDKFTCIDASVKENKYKILNKRQDDNIVQSLLRNMEIREQANADKNDTFTVNPFTESVSPTKYMKMAFPESPNVVELGHLDDPSFLLPWKREFFLQDNKAEFSPFFDY